MLIYFSGKYVMVDICQLAPETF